MKHASASKAKEVTVTSWLLAMQPISSIPEAIQAPNITEEEQVEESEYSAVREFLAQRWPDAASSCLQNSNVRGRAALQTLIHRITYTAKPATRLELHMAVTKCPVNKLESAQSACHLLVWALALEHEPKYVICSHFGALEKMNEAYKRTTLSRISDSFLPLKWLLDHNKTRSHPNDFQMIFSALCHVVLRCVPVNSEAYQFLKDYTWYKPNADALQWAINQIQAYTHFQPDREIFDEAGLGGSV